MLACGAVENGGIVDTAMSDALLMSKSLMYGSESALLLESGVIGEYCEWKE